MIHHLLDIVAHYLHLHPIMGICFAFIIAFLESLPVIGLIIPGTITMTAVGAMIGAGWLPGYITLGVSALGAFTGDIAGFLIGYIFKDKLRTVWPFKQHPKIISYSTDFIGKHGGKSILIGRFVGAARSAVPMVAGLLRLSWLRFLFAALPTSILWTIAYTLPGMIFGAFSLEIPPKLLTEYLVIGIIIISLLWLAYWLIQRSFNKIRDYYHAQMRCYWHWLQHRSPNFLTKYIANRQEPECHLQLNRLLLMIIFGCLFLLIAATVYCKLALFQINMPLFDFAQSLRIHHLDSFFAIITLMGSPGCATIIGVSLGILLLFAKQPRASLHLLAAVLLSTAAATAFKWLQFNPRPTGFMIVQTSSSFPSGHTTMSVVVFGLLTFFTGQYFKNHRNILYTTTGVFIALVGVSRLYLGAHWFLDVVGGAFLGLTILLFIIIHYQRLPKSTSTLSLQPWTWLFLSFAVSFAVWAAGIHHGYKSTLYSATPFQQKTTLSLKNWWRHPLNYVPAYRNNRFGYPIQPLNIQWADTLDHIKTTLLANQWQLITRDNHVKDTIQRLSSLQPQYHLPFFELLYRNERPALVLYKPTTDKSAIYILRLWDSHIELEDNHHLWIGMLNKELSPGKRMIGMHHQLMSFAHLDAPAILVNSTQLQQLQTKVVTDNPAENKSLHYAWDGKIWLVLG